MNEPAPKAEKDELAKLIQTDDRMGLLRWAVNDIEGRQIRYREALREQLKASDLPLPAELFEKLTQLNSLHLNEVMLDHPGHKIWNRHGSYRLSLRIFERAVVDLISAIGRFEKSADDGIFERVNDEKLEEFEGAIQKELFAVTNAAHSLVDHARRLQSEVGILDFDAIRKTCFGDDHLHDFIFGLRTLLHHLHSVEAGWNLTNDFKGGKTASFMLRRRDLQLALDQSPDSFSKGQLKSIRDYLVAAPEKLNLKLVFEEYHRRVARFNGWFREQLAADSLVGLRDYDRCIQENKKRAQRQFWHAMIGNWLNWPTPPNPYDHLPRYLTPEQLPQVYALPLQSDEQIDLAIKYGDREGICDDGLRKQIHRLFKLATPQPSAAT